MYASLGGQFMRMHPVVIMAGTPGTQGESHGGEISMVFVLKS